MSKDRVLNNVTSLQLASLFKDVIEDLDDVDPDHVEAVELLPDAQEEDD